MKMLAGLCLTLALLSPAHADGNRAIPLPRDRPEIVQAQTTNPDPFNVRRNDPAPQIQAPPPAAAPIVVNAPPQGMGILSWIQTALATLATGLLGKMAFLPGGGGTSTTPAGSSQSEIATALKAVFTPGGTSFINDPALRTKIDSALLQVVQSGIPGTAIQSGISLIPGAGAIGGIVEPMVRRAVEAALEARLGQPGSTAPSTGSLPIPTDQLQPFIDQIKALIEAKVHPPAAAHPAA